MDTPFNFLDRNEFNFEPSQKVVDAIKNFDPKTLCFYTRIYDRVSIPASMIRARRVSSLYVSVRSTVCLKNRCCLLMAVRIC